MFEKAPSHFTTLLHLTTSTSGKGRVSEVILMSQWEYKPKGLVAHVGTPEYPFHLSMMWQTTWQQHQRKCEVHRDDSVNFCHVYQTVLLPMYNGQLTWHIQMSKIKLTLNLRFILLLIKIIHNDIESHSNFAYWSNNIYCVKT